MTTYIALLRGINVSGHKKIAMTHLKSVFETIGFANIRTYIQSGNVLFESEEQEPRKLERTIERELERAYGFAVNVVVRTKDELRAVIDRNPFALRELADGDQLYVTFWADVPEPEAVQRLAAYSGDVDEYAFAPREVYLLCRKGYGTSKFSNNFLENKLKLPATTRNWATVNKLAAMADG